MRTWYLVNKSGMVTLYNKSENNRFFLEKKMGIIVAIKSQRYLSTFCPTAQLHITGIFLKTVLNKQYSSNFAIFIITTHIFQKSMNYMNNIK